MLFADGMFHAFLSNESRLVFLSGDSIHYIVNKAACVSSINKRHFPQNENCVRDLHHQIWLMSALCESLGRIQITQTRSMFSVLSFQSLNDGGLSLRKSIAVTKTFVRAYIASAYTVHPRIKVEQNIARIIVGSRLFHPFSFLLQHQNKTKRFARAIYSLSLKYNAHIHT